jgi:biotin operon repressor
MPPTEKSNAFLVAERLESLNISLLSEWDVLIFLYRHGTILTSASQISHLLGYSTAAITAALDRLQSSGFIVRSRSSSGIRLYQFCIPGNSSRCASFMELMILAEKRAGRLELLKHLLRDKTPLSHVGGLRLA